MSRRDDDFTDYVKLRLTSLHRVAVLLCQDWHRADDLVQSTITKLYVHWGKARAADNTDAYVRAMLVREFLQERRTGWAKRVRLAAEPQDDQCVTARADTEAEVDLRAALARLPHKQRATLVLRFYCDLSVEQAAELLGCSPGTVKSQTARGLDSLRRSPEVGAFLQEKRPPGTVGKAEPSEVPTNG
ncbi:MAG TPA: SigE family RNA polymerase sigma factor [Streptosporangiaceae bacterium]|nr:SigE family RNA polymerase sigma factor [Streptosporangiaceae bacterium]